MQMNYEFDASQYTPNQGGGAIHPVGRFPFLILKTEIVGNQAGNGGYLTVTYKTPEGEIADRFNLWHENPVTVRIAHEQLSALCHAVGIFKVSMSNEGAALLNAQGMIEVVKQGGDNPKGYTQVAKRLDRNGNEPGQQGGNNAGQQQQNNGPSFGNNQQQGGGFQPQGQGNGPGGFQPQGQQPQGQQPQEQAQQGQNNGQQPSWGQQGGQNVQQATQGQQPPAGQGGWQQGNNGGGNGQPSWGQR